MESFSDWIFDDRTWCTVDCEMKVCYRNKKLMKNPTGVHSFSDFRGTKECLRYKPEEKDG